MYSATNISSIVHIFSQNTFVIKRVTTVQFILFISVKLFAMSKLSITFFTMKHEFTDRCYFSTNLKHL